MNRRMALTVAGTVALVVTTGSAAVAANLGILGSAAREPVGQLDAQSVVDLDTPATLAPVVVTVDEVVPVEVPADPAPVVDDHGDDGDARAEPGDDRTGSTSAAGVGTTPATAAAAAPTTAAPRVDDSGPGRVDDHGGDDRSGHGGGDDSHDDD